MGPGNIKAQFIHTHSVYESIKILSYNPRVLSQNTSPGIRVNAISAPAHIEIGSEILLRRRYIKKVNKMLSKNSAIHIIDAANSLLLYEEDMLGMHELMEMMPEEDVITGYRRYITEIIRQCSATAGCHTRLNS